MNVHMYEYSLVGASRNINKPVISLDFARDALRAITLKKINTEIN